jgi:type I restriction enzyme S subunit
MKNILLAMPTVQEQQTIAAFLDHNCAKIDALIAEQEKLITLLREKRQAVISHAVTKGLNPDAPMKDSGVEWLGEVPERWEAFNFRRIITCVEQGWSPNASSEPCQNGDWGVLKISAIKFGHFIQDENKALLDDVLPIEAYQIFAGDLLLTRANTPDLVGDCCVVSTDLQRRLMMSDLVYRIRLDSGINAHFFSYLLRSNFGRSQIKADARGSSMTMAKISQGHIKDWIVVMPSPAEQQAIVTYLDTETAKIDVLIAESEKAVVLLKERRSSLISAAVTGKIDVRDIHLQEAI